MRVALIPTGRMELLGLPKLLERLFPAHAFQSLGRDWGSPLSSKEPLHGFTSRPVRLPDALEWDSLRELVLTCVAALQPGGLQTFDCCVVLEDLELANRTQPGVVTRAFSEAVARHLLDVPPRTRAILRPLFRERCSFHLAVPMTESWFFGDPAALQNASVPVSRLPSLLQPSTDPEAFQTADPTYSADTSAHCTAWLAQSARRRSKSRPQWMLEGREHHPKAYISWLCRRPESRNCTSYGPTSGGKRALQKLDLTVVLNNNTHFTYLRALIADLADALGAWPTGVPQQGVQAPLTSIHTLSPSPVLRNL